MKTEKQYNDSLTLFGMAAIGICIIMLTSTIYKACNQPSEPTIDLFLDGTEKTPLDTMRSIIPEGKGIIEYPDGRIDSIRWYPSKLNPSYNNIDTVYITDTVYLYNPIHYRQRDLIDAICMVESSGRNSAHNISEDAVGILQIRQCMVNDVNRILKRRGVHSLYSMEDRWNTDKSLEMFHIYTSHYGLESPEEIARCWNGGPRGMSNTYTEPYWNKVQSYLDDSYVLDEDV